MAEKRVRIRLKFQDAGILTKQQIDQGLAQCWHLVRFDELRTIADVASDISSIFNLGESCPSGLGLEVDGFALPSSQPAHLLKDSDLVRIRRRKDPSVTPGAGDPRGVRNDQHFVINGYRCASYGGLELRAIDEFEKETGGYKSEEEEGEMETDISLDGGGRVLGVPKITPLFLKQLKRSNKKRKRSKDPGTDSGKKKKSSSCRLDLSVANVEGKQEKFRTNKGSRRAGIKHRALGEFEDELGGYESEQEEDENEEETDLSLGGTKTVVPFEVRPSGTPKEERRSAKKQRGSKKEGLDLLDEVQMQQLQGSLNNCEEESKEAPKKKKKKTSEVNIGRSTKDSVESGPVKDKEKKSSKRAEKAEALQTRDKNKDAQPEDSRLNDSLLVTTVDWKSLRGKKLSKGNGKSELLSACKVGDDSWVDLEDTLMDSDHHEDKQRKEDIVAKGGATNFITPVKDSQNTPAGEVHRPSRSARRKKAKRKWLREQQVKEQHPEVQAAKMPTEEHVDKGFPNNEKVEVQAVEELQPVVIRAGHIRFESYDEDDSGGLPRSSLPIINLGKQLKSKRQGQNWGQEKFAEKQKGKRLRQESENEECADVVDPRNGRSKTAGRVHKADLEKLPPLQGAPQEGDVIAYRLVELTPTWTPELSPYRVGVVVSVDQKTDGLKFAPHPDYPFRATRDAELDDGGCQEYEAYPFPYDEDGFLETELPSLVDLRLVEKKLGSNRAQEDEEAVGQNANDITSANPEDGPSSVPSAHEIGEHLQSSGPNNPQVENETQLIVTEGSDPNTPQAMMNIKDPNEKGETEKDAVLSPEWQTLLTQELQRKKLEIRQKNADSQGNQTSGDPEKKSSARDRKSKYLRSAGVGSIVALLRAQQAL